MIGALPVLAGFLAPALYLLVEALKRLRGEGASPQLLAALGNTVAIAAATTGAALLLALVVSWALRLARTPSAKAGTPA